MAFRAEEKYQGNNHVVDVLSTKSTDASRTILCDKWSSCALVARGARVAFSGKRPNIRLEGIEIERRSQVSAFILQWRLLVS